MNQAVVAVRFKSTVGLAWANAVERIAELELACAEREARISELEALLAEHGIAPGGVDERADASRGVGSPLVRRGDAVNGSERRGGSS